MEHDQLPKHATQRYFLDEMSEDERSAFEAHYFDCVLCATDVKDAARLMAAGREIAREPAAPQRTAEIHEFRSPSQRWYPRLATAAAIAFAAVIAWQTLTIRDLRSNENRGGIASIYEVTTSQTRGLPAGSSLRSIRAGELATVMVEILPPAQETESFVISVRSAAGRVEQSDSVSFEQAADPIPVVLRELPRGSYEMVIEGVRRDGNRFEITRHPFEVVAER